MDLPLDPVGNLKILFWVDPARGGIILEKLKNPNFPHMAQDGRRNPFAAHFAHFFENLDTFFNGPSGARPVKGLSTGWFYRAAKRPVPS